MADLLDKKTGTETRAPTTPEKQRLDLRPKLEKPPAPRIYRWIQWMALFVIMAVAAVLAAVLLGGGSEEVVAGPVGQEAEHGQYTRAVLVDRTAAALPIFVGTSPPNLDLDLYVEHGQFTPMAIRDMTGVQLPRGFVGTDPPDLYPVEPGVPDALGRFLDRQELPAPDALARYLERTG
jgi:hypothetical protein